MTEKGPNPAEAGSGHLSDYCVFGIQEMSEKWLFSGFRGSSESDRNTLRFVWCRIREFTGIRGPDPGFEG